MATFTNFATLSYNGGTTTSNIVTGRLLETLFVSKTAVMDDYTARDDVTYVVTLCNSGTAPLTGLTVTDDLGAYQFEGDTVYPLEYTPDSLHYYVNGVLQAPLAVADSQPLSITDISVPAGGCVMLIYEAAVTNYAPLGVDDTITNTVTVTGCGMAAPVTASEIIYTEDRADLTISKAVSPAAVTNNGQLTYTFVIANHGNTPAVATDDVVVTDVFDPILNPISVTFESDVWVEGVNYTYNEATGAFATLPGQITVPAATYTRNDDGTWTVNPGTVTLVVTGTV